MPRTAKQYDETTNQEPKQPRARWLDWIMSQTIPEYDRRDISLDGGGSSSGGGKASGILGLVNTGLAIANKAGAPVPSSVPGTSGGGFNLGSIINPSGGTPGMPGNIGGIPGPPNPNTGGQPDGGYNTGGGSSEEQANPPADGVEPTHDRPPFGEAPLGPGEPIPPTTTYPQLNDAPDLPYGSAWDEVTNYLTENPMWMTTEAILQLRTGIPPDQVAANLGMEPRTVWQLYENQTQMYEVPGFQHGGKIRGMGIVGDKKDGDPREIVISSDATVIPIDKAGISPRKLDRIQKYQSGGRIRDPRAMSQVPPQAASPSPLVRMIASGGKFPQEVIQPGAQPQNPASPNQDAYSAAVAQGPPEAPKPSTLKRVLAGLAMGVPAALANAGAYRRGGTGQGGGVSNFIRGYQDPTPLWSPGYAQKVAGYESEMERLKTLADMERQRQGDERAARVTEADMAQSSAAARASDALADQRRAGMNAQPQQTAEESYTEQIYRDLANQDRSVREAALQRLQEVNTAKSTARPSEASPEAEYTNQIYLDLASNDAATRDAAIERLRTVSQAKSTARPPEEKQPPTQRDFQAIRARKDMQLERMGRELTAELQSLEREHAMLGGLWLPGESMEDKKRELVTQYAQNAQKAQEAFEKEIETITDGRLQPFDMYSEFMNKYGGPQQPTPSSAGGPRPPSVPVPLSRPGAIPPEVNALLANERAGTYTLSDGSIWVKGADGSIGRQ